MSPAAPVVGAADVVMIIEPFNEPADAFSRDDMIKSRIDTKVEAAQTAVRKKAGHP